jgi:hypothetical protein
MAVTLHIEQLVLHGFDPRDRHAIGDALRGELATLMTARALPAEAAHIDHLDAGSVAIDGVRSPAAPRAIAGAVHAKVTQ